jgi:thiamine-phosphate pyrophosphorylase
MSPEERGRVLRVVDANLNRAVEALRVVEEHARFVRAEPGLARRLQGVRRDIARAIEGAGVLAGERLAARDVAGDPGRPDDSAAGEQPGRSSVSDLLLANVSRAKEALRTLEEWTKLVAPEACDALARARYAVYALEPELLLLRPSLEGRGVYVLSLAEQARLCLEGGVRLFQLRHKSLEGNALAAAARGLGELLASAGALLIVNDRPDVAVVAGAAGVHLGQGDLDPRDARRIVGPALLIGASAHDEAELRTALEAGVDHVGFGTLFSSPTKPDLGSQGLARLRALAPTCPVPIYGIGGVTAASAAAVIEAGAAGVAVSSAVLDADDPARAARELVEVVAGALEKRKK